MMAVGACTIVAVDPVSASAKDAWNPAARRQGAHRRAGPRARRGTPAVVDAYHVARVVHPTVESWGVIERVQPVCGFRFSFRDAAQPAMKIE